MGREEKENIEERVIEEIKKNKKGTRKDNLYNTIMKLIEDTKTAFKSKNSHYPKAHNFQESKLKPLHNHEPMNALIPMCSVPALGAMGTTCRMDLVLFDMLTS